MGRGRRLGFAQTHQGPTVAALRFAVLSGPQTAPLPRKRLASSAAGGASPLSPGPYRLLKKAGENFISRKL